MPTDYADAVAAYLKERADAETEIRAADTAYRTETERLTDAVDNARTARDEANRASVEAATLVAETDKTVAVLWRALGDFVGHRRTGPTPSAGEPDPEPDAPRVRARLERSARLLSLARQGELPIEAPRHTEATAAAIGAATGALAVALALWILGTDASTARQALAALTLFLGIATGPIALGVWLAWQYRVRPRPAQTLACVGAAVAAVCALAGLFMRGLLRIRAMPARPRMALRAKPALPRSAYWATLASPRSALWATLASPRSALWATLASPQLAPWATLASPQLALWATLASPQLALLDSMGYTWSVPET